MAAAKPADKAAIDGSGVQNGGPPKKTPPSSKFSAVSKEHTLLGVNGTGQRKDYGPTKPAVVSEPISTEVNEKKLQLFYPASGTGKPIKINGTGIVTDDDEIFEDFDKPDVETNNIATTNNITAFKEVINK